MTASVSALRSVQPRLSSQRLAKFALVGASGFVVNSTVLALAVGALGMHYLVGAVLATLASTASNFALTERYVFGDREGTGRRGRRFAVFCALSLVTLVARGPILVGLTEWVGLHYLLSNAVSLVCMMLVRYQFSGSRIWPEEQR